MLAFLIKSGEANTVSKVPDFDFIIVSELMLHQMNVYELKK